MEKIGASYLYDQNSKKLEEMTKEKFATALYKYAKTNALVAYYGKELQAKKDMRKVFLNATYEETVKKMHFNKIAQGIYSYGQSEKTVAIIVTINTTKEKLEKYLGIKENNNVTKNRHELNKANLLDWLAEHKETFKDFCNAIGVNYAKASDCNNDKWLNEFKNIDLRVITDWILENKTLTEDFCNWFKVKVQYYAEAGAENGGESEFFDSEEEAEEWLNSFCNNCEWSDCEGTDITREIVKDDERPNKKSNNKNKEKYVIYATHNIGFCNKEGSVTCPGNATLLEKHIKSGSIISYSYDKAVNECNKLNNKYKTNKNVKFIPMTIKDAIKKIRDWVGDAKVSERDMRAFERVRQSGVTNMFARDLVCQLAGISKETYMEIISGDNYSKYMEMYGIKRG